MTASRYLHTSKPEVHRSTCSLHVRISAAVLKALAYRTYDICEYDAGEAHLANPPTSICGFFEYQTTPPSGSFASADWQGTLEEIPSQSRPSIRIDSICDSIPSFPYISNELQLCQALQDVWYPDSALRDPRPGPFDIT